MNRFYLTFSNTLSRFITASSKFISNAVVVCSLTANALTLQDYLMQRGITILTILHVCNKLTKSDAHKNASTTPAINAAQFKLPIYITTN